MKLSEALFKAGDSMLEDRDLRDLLWEAASLAKRVEDAPVGNVGDVGKGHRWVRIRGELPPDMHERRVAIVSLEETP